MASARPSRRPGSWTRTAAVVAAGVLTMTGCSATNPITTSMAYNVVDGVQANLADGLAGHNLQIFTSGEGEVGAMSGALINQTRDDVEYTIEVEGADRVTVEVPAQSTVLLGPAGEEVRIDSVDAPPGAALPVTLSTPQAGSLEVRIPVFDGTLPEYEDAVPEAEGDDA